MLYHYDSNIHVYSIVRFAALCNVKALPDRLDDASVYTGQVT